MFFLQSFPLFLKSWHCIPARERLPRNILVSPHLFGILITCFWGGMAWLPRTSHRFGMASNPGPSPLFLRSNQKRNKTLFFHLRSRIVSNGTLLLPKPRWNLRPKKLYTLPVLVSEKNWSSKRKQISYFPISQASPVSETSEQQFFRLVIASWTLTLITVTQLLHRCIRQHFARPIPFPPPPPSSFLDGGGSEES